MCTKKYHISENNISLCKVQKYIDEKPIWITKPYMKAFFEEKKIYHIMDFSFPMFLMYRQVHTKPQNFRKQVFIMQGAQMNW